MRPALYSEVFGQGPNLLLVHGWGMHGGVWGEFAELLARDFRVTAVDLPGHGYSPMVANDSLTGWAEAVLAVAPARAHWLGCSLGAQIALHVAAMHPDRVQRLLMLSGNPCFVAEPDWPTAMATELFEDFNRLVESDGADALPRFLALQAQGAGWPRPLLKQMQELLGRRPAPVSQVLLAGLDMLRTTDLRAALADLECPAMALLGANDALVPVTVGDRLKQLRPSLRLAVLPGTAHQAFHSHPSDCARLAAEFLLTNDRA